jgi:hypothetical protein
MKYKIEMRRYSDWYRDTGAINEGGEPWLELCNEHLRRIWDIPDYTNMIWLTVHTTNPRNPDAACVKLRKRVYDLKYVGYTIYVPGYQITPAPIDVFEYPLEPILTHYDKPPKTITVWVTAEIEDVAHASK